MNRRMLKRTIAPALFVLFVAGCSLLTGPSQTTPTRYWILTSESETKSGAQVKKLPSVSLGVGPFSFPSYLENPQLVVRNEPNQISFWPLNRWAEPLPDGFLRILGENLGHELGTSRLALFPWYRVNLKYQIMGEVTRLEPDGNGGAILDCRWSLYRTADKEYLHTQHEVLRQKLDEDTPAAVADALSQLIADLAHSIALTIDKEETAPGA